MSPQFWLGPLFLCSVGGQNDIFYLEMQETVKSIKCSTEPDTVWVRKPEELGLICGLSPYMIKRKDCLSWHKGPRFITSIFSMSSFIAS